MNTVSQSPQVTSGLTLMVVYILGVWIDVQSVTYPPLGFPGGASGKEPACQGRRCERCKFSPWMRKIPWRRAWQPTPVLLPGESPWTEELGRVYFSWKFLGQRTLVGYSPKGCKESDTAEESYRHACLHRLYIEREIKKCLELALVKTTVCGS